MAYTTIDDGSAHFQVALYTGNNSNRDITNDGNSDLQPDFIWGKSRSTVDAHTATDSSRGNTKVLSPHVTEVEGTATDYVTAFNSDGFSLGTNNGMNKNTLTYVAWQWKCNGGTRVTNTESGNNPGGGYQVNTTAGFSIVDFTGTGGAGTMAHGLGAVPKFYIVKGRDVGGSWRCYHASNGSDPETDSLKLDENIATADLAGWWNDTAPTSTVFSLGDDDQVNDDAGTYIGYFWTEIQGYSKFGSYTGNNNANGTFVYCGFKPAFIMIKRTDSSGQWVINDSTRSPTNPSNHTLNPDENWVETTNGYYGMDILSNGFKLLTNNAETNGASTNHVFIAFAEHPFVSSEGVPCTAR